VPKVKRENARIDPEDPEAEVKISPTESVSSEIAGKFLHGGKIARKE
jgi:hypothetical protein